MRRQKVLLGTNEFGEEQYDYIYPLKKSKKQKVRVKHEQWGYGFAKNGAVNQHPYAVYCAKNSKDEPVPVVIIPLKEVQRMCKALNIKLTQL